MPQSKHSVPSYLKYAVLHKLFHYSLCSVSIPCKISCVMQKETANCLLLTPIKYGCC
jgi:hypothetical protein